MPILPEATTELPKLTPAEQASMALYWVEYDANYTAIRTEILPLIAALPDFAATFKTRSKQDMEAESLRSHELMARALRDGEWQPYLEDLRGRGAAYAKLGVEFTTWFHVVALFHTFLIPRIVEKWSVDRARLSELLVSGTRLMSISLSVIGVEYLRSKDEASRRQQAAILELSTPVLQFRDRMLVLPVIGVVDSNRARQLTEQLLHAIRANRARVVVMDITGVPVVDTQVANHLVQTVESARLMGATVIVTGLSPDVARALATLGLDLSKLNTVGDLQGGIEEADRVAGFRVAHLGEPSPQIGD